ncbi:MAG: branched-chain amino acid ABC transporter permease [Pyrobaculum sp.]
MVGLLLSILFFWAYLSLVAAGLQFIYGSARVLNLAHASFFVLGGYLASYLSNFLSWPLPASVAAASAAGAAAGLVLYIALARISDEVDQLVFTYSVFWLFEAFFRGVFGYGLYSTADTAARLGVLTLGDQRVPVANLVGVASVVAVFAALYFVMSKTTFGMFLRAVVDNPPAAEAFGVPLRRVVALGVALGSALAAFGGSISSMWQNFNVGLAGVVLVYAFAAVAVGGLGNVFGALAASFIISLVRALAVYYFPEVELFAIYLVVLTVLTLRPSGLFVRYERRV